MSALTDPRSLVLRDPAVVGDCRDDPAWRALFALPAPRAAARRVSNQAPTADPQLAVVQGDWEQALDAVLADWRTQVTPAQRRQIRDQVRAAAEAGDVAALAALSLPAGAGAEVLASAMAELSTVAGARMADELAAQGAPVVAPAVVTAAVLAPAATAAATLLAAGLAAKAAAAAVKAWRPGVDPGSVVKAVDGVLDGLSDRVLSDQLGGALSQAQNVGRLMTAHDLEVGLGGDPGDPEDPDAPADDYVPQIIYSSSEVNDRNTCWQCHQVDGTVYDSWIEAWVDYGGGRYRGCEGGWRCRGTVVARWNPAAGA